jgi:hypothetical protein
MEMVSPQPTNPQNESVAGPSKSDLYPAKEEGKMENLPNRSVQSLAEPGVRTHGAADISDSVYWTGHVVGLVLIVLALVLIFLGRGARKSDAMPRLWEQKVQTLPGRPKAGG